MRVMHVSLGLKTGGMERLLADFARFHTRERIEPSFVALHDAGQPAVDIAAVGCRVEVLNGQNWGRVRRVRELVRLFKTSRVDVVHTHNTFAHVYATVAARLAGVPVVVHTRHGQRLGSGRGANLQFRLACRWVDRVVAISDDVARICRDEDHLPASKVARIWNGIDLERFRFTGPAPEPTAICVARLSPEKDFPTLLDAAALTIEHLPEFRLQIVGAGPEHERLERIVAERGLKGHVLLLGERNDVPALLAKAGFFVSSSLTEGVSLTLLEAMAVGLPVIATAVGGNPEVVDNGTTGRLVPAGDPEALSAAMHDLCRDRGQWQQFGVNGRSRVEKHFEIGRMVRDYEALYETLHSERDVGQGRRRAAGGGYAVHTGSAAGEIVLAVPECVAY